MDRVINLRLLINPINWLVVLMFLTIAGIAGHLALTLVGQEPATGPTPTSAYQPVNS